MNKLSPSTPSLAKKLVSTQSLRDASMFAWVGFSNNMIKILRML